MPQKPDGIFRQMQLQHQYQEPEDIPPIRYRRYETIFCSDALAQGLTFDDLLD